MSSKTYDINQPILVVIRRGRGGRGYTVAPVDSPTDIAACADVEQVGDAIIEMLDDDKQPRVDIDALLRAAEGDIQDDVQDDKDGESANLEASDEEGDEDEGEEDDEEEEEEQPWYKASDPADALLITGLSKLLEKGRKVSRHSRRRGRRGRKTKRT